MRTINVFIFPCDFGGFVQWTCSSPDGLFNLCHVTLSAHTVTLLHAFFYSRQQQHTEMLMSLINSLAIYKGQSVQKTKSCKGEQEPWDSVICQQWGVSLLLVVSSSIPYLLQATKMRLHLVTDEVHMELGSVSDIYCSRPAQSTDTELFWLTNIITLLFSISLPVR